PVKAGTRFGPELFQKVWDYHFEWTNEFFAEQDRMGAVARFDRSKAPVIMDLLRGQLLSPRWVQHSARVLFVVGQAGAAERAGILEALFACRSRAEVAKRVRAGKLPESVLAVHDYVYDVFDGDGARPRPAARRPRKTGPARRKAAARRPPKGAAGRAGKARPARPARRKKVARRR
ncbi:MAG TPA: hypothetical protein VLS93_09895, partial [Anaeromyxobacteraceae bacterium]|nr:hypothetical protein [Anaeromyxobacteraceae bacterium]